jgi:CRP-like cAMP-binding protein
LEKQALLNFIQQIMPMSPEKAAQIAAFFHLRLAERHQHLHQEGKICTTSYFVEEGLIRSYVIDTEGREVTIEFYGKNIFANDFLSFFKRTPSRENFQALSDLRLWAISYDDLQRCFHEMPEFREFGRMMLINTYSRLKDRMLGMIQETAEQRYLHLLETRPQVAQEAPLKMIATYLGVTDTSLSRIRKDLAKK